MEFTLRRNVRLTLWLVILVTGTYYLCDLVAGDKYDRPDGRETFTTYCLKERGSYIDGDRITDLNCSLEDGRKRVYISLSETGLAELRQKLPFNSVVYSCAAHSVSQFLADRESSDPERIISEFMTEHKIAALCTPRSEFTAGSLSLEYVNSRNELQTEISLVYGSR